MARKIQMKCPKCGLKAERYDGKGLFGQRIVSVVCHDCKSVQQLVVGGVIGEVAPSFSSVTGRLCPHCGSADISLWDGCTCPYCHVMMEKDGNPVFWT